MKPKAIRWDGNVAYLGKNRNKLFVRTDYSSEIKRGTEGLEDQCVALYESIILQRMLGNKVE
jgi:hypothetical protein